MTKFKLYEREKSGTFGRNILNGLKMLKALKMDILLLCGIFIAREHFLSQFVFLADANIVTETLVANCWRFFFEAVHFFFQLTKK